MLMSRAMAGAGRRELLAEISRQLHADGFYDESQDELTRPRDDWMSLVPYLWVAGRLLARPASAHSMVHSTVKNYALTAEAAGRIREIPQTELERCFK
jgi:hypothetical protein